ncbi:MAG: histidinol-phosphate transaminase [Lachnospiraceae bacterium]|nr:histidinol-phosphate transaminase [Lachnospiraceae bacterium]
MKAWEKNIRKVVPYVPGEQPKKANIIKLNTNENPYPPAPGVLEALKHMDTDLLRRYPDPTAAKLVNAVAKFHRLDSSQVFVGVGSDDVLAMAFLTCFNSDKPILFPDITYSFYDVWADLFRIPYEKQPLDENFKICSNDYKKENGGIIFPNPNAPTGVLKPLDEIEEIIKNNSDVIVIVDEAYIDFGGNSALPLLEKYDNLLIAQTFSKSRSMAGMRIGYLLGNADIIRYINDCKYSFNSYTMNQTAIELGVEAIRDRAYFEQCTQKIIDTREWSKKEFAALGFTFEDSMSNFVFVTHPKYSAVEIFEALRGADIYVRHFKSPERISNYLRITIGTKEEMETLFAFLKQYMSKE